MSLWVAKIISVLVLFFGTFICGISPALVKWYTYHCHKNNVGRHLTEQVWLIRQGRSLTSFLMCFGGGVLFSTCFIHLLPELRTMFEDYWKKTARMTGNTTGTVESKGFDHSHHFPLPEFIVCGGFLLVYGIEEVVYYLTHKLYQNGSPEMEIRSTTSSRRTLDHPENVHKEESDDLIVSDNKPAIYGTVSESLQEEKPSPLIPEPCPTLLTTQDSQMILLKSGLSLRGILTVIALSFHSIFEGFSIGLQHNETETWTVLFAISVHKFVIAVIIGMETVQAGTILRVIIPYMLVFSSMSPIGMIVAMIAHSVVDEGNGLLGSCLMSVSTGTLIYITFFEILLKERKSELPGNLQFLGIFVGFITMTLIESFTIGL